MARPTAGPGRSTSPPRPSEGQGKPLCGRRVGPLLFWDLVALFCWQRVTGTQGLLSGMGAFFVPPHRPFFTRTFFVPAPGFFFFWAFGACALRGEQDAILEHAWNDEFRELPRIPRRTP